MVTVARADTTMAALLRTVVPDQTGGGATAANPVMGRHGGGGSGSGDGDESRWTQRRRPRGGRRRQVLGAGFRIFFYFIFLVFYFGHISTVTQK